MRPKQMGWLAGGLGWSSEHGSLRVLRSIGTPMRELSVRLKSCWHILLQAGFVSVAVLAGCGSWQGGKKEAERASVPAPDTSRQAASPAADTAQEATGDTTVVAPVGAVEVFPAAELGRVGDALARGTTTARTLVRHADFLPIEARRSSSGVPEVHADWIDVTWVQAGRARLLTGGRVSGGHQQSPGELRGGSIQGGASRPIAAGDVFVIPAGTPHQFVLSSGDTIRYLTVKVRDQRSGARSRQ